ncbi:5-formyltetrahydrofolate cyclo-ligase [Thermodesulfobium acidiphilum]|uniref:5-formyltetrahydrofolate cyclo-ligase n=1 Tax=Thermodesulfobium acidiphilum TaxID=1794699 RepID=A0A2R4W0H1_THEAF|nr:5-formyltetrahydrofolate cyclo-ligase [Thermodesulfobium acidiphilum]AWB10303.1 5-formyltetrahydrofolate cyclo-ligase [Thermodesulfobium acidiphilum]PMP86227.1 MAG: 5-formyltetrahydrofolate cyclo-ligase [Thermodesulfobium narugense]
MEKILIRERVLRKRESLSLDFQKSMSQVICLMIIKSFFYLEADSLMLYSSIKGEVDLKTLYTDALKRHKKVFLPTVSLKNIKINPVQCFVDTIWERGPYGIFEPLYKPNRIKQKNFDLVFIPGVAFDRNFNRIGFGKGFYDKFLKKLPKTTLKIGVAFDVQIVENINSDPWDIKMDIIVTEKGFLCREES